MDNIQLCCYIWRHERGKHGWSMREVSMGSLHNLVDDMILDRL